MIISTPNPPQAPLSLLVFGAGAIGTYIGGSLALAGHQAVFVERPEVAAELKARGLRLEIEGITRRLEMAAVYADLDRALAAGTYDAALLALKAYDTPAMIERLRPFAAQLPPVLCLQNGVENEPLLAEALGAEKVIAGTVTSAVGRRAAGDIVLERKRGLGLSAGHPVSARLAQAMQAAGLNARLYPRPADMKWSKLLTNLLANASSAILDLTPSEVFAHPALYRLEIEQLREALRVMARMGVGVTDLPGTPVRLLAFAAGWLPPGLSRPLLGRAVGGGRGGKMPSLHIDLNSGKKQSEVAFLNGAIDRFGMDHGVETPVNRLLTERLLQLTRGEMPLDRYTRQPERLLAELG
jgi:2-dehydropantoate 2-reductase